MKKNGDLDPAFLFVGPTTKKTKKNTHLFTSLFETIQASLFVNSKFSPLFFAPSICLLIYKCTSKFY